MDFASIGIRADTSEVEKGKSNLDAFAVSAERVEEAAEGVSEAFDAIGQTATTASTGLNNTAAAQDQAAKAGQRFLAALREQVALFGKSSEDVLRYQAAQAGVGREAAPLILQLQNQRAAQEQAAVAALREAQAQREAAQEKRSAEAAQRSFLNSLREQVALQGRSQEDILRYRAQQLGVSDQAESLIKQLGATSVATGAATLSARQYSQALRMLPAQITDVVTSLASGSPAYLVAIQQGGQIRDSFGSIGTALRAIGSVITPARLGIGLAVGAGIALAKAFNDGQQESFELTKQLTITGDVAGVTAGQLHEMARSIDAVVGTRAAATETLAQIASTGRVAAGDLERFGIAAQLIARNLDQPVDETVKNLNEIGRSPVEAAVKLNQQYNFLTEALYDQIVAAERRGDVDEAAALAQNAYIEEFQRRALAVEKELPALQGAARATGSAFKEMWDSVTGAFVPETPEARLRELREQRGDRPLFGGRARFDYEFENRDREEEALAKQIEQSQRRAEERAAEAKRIRDKERERQEITARLQSQRAIADATAGATAAGIQRDLDDALAQFAAFESQLEAQRDARLISEEDYYTERRKLIEQSSGAQIRALEEENRLLEAQGTRIRERAQLDADHAQTAADRSKVESTAQTLLIANQSKILDNESKIARLRQQAIAETNTLTTNQQAANRALEQSYLDARDAAQQYLDTLERANQRQLDGFGRGDRQREIDAARNEIDDRFAQQRLELAGDLRRQEITKEQYDRELEIINEFNQKALASTSSYYDQLAEKQGSFFTGAQESLANYLDSSQNVAEQSEALFTRAFSGMEDALVEFAMTGKLSFKSFAESIIADLLRIQIRAALAGILGNASGGFWGSLFGGSTGGLGAGGGNVPTSGGAMFADTGIRRVPRDNQVAILHKDEAVIPARMNPFAGGNGIGGPRVNITQYLNPAPGNDVGQFRALMEQSRRAAVQEVFENFKYGRWAGVAS